jgi:hypothetical protein
MATRQPPQDPQLSGLAASGIAFAAWVLTLVGVFQVVAGLTAIFDDETCFPPAAQSAFSPRTPVISR